MDNVDSPSRSEATRFFYQLGMALQVFRGRTGLSAAQAARKARVGKSQMSKYETGKESPKIETLARILDALEVEPLWFFYLMHQLSRDRPIEALKVDLLLLREGIGSSMPKDAAEGFLRVFSDLLDLHALVAGEARLAGDLPRSAKHHASAEGGGGELAAGRRRVKNG